jgi:hypothetical protein
MHRIGYETILRACGFGMLVILCFMVGLHSIRWSSFSCSMLAVLMTGILSQRAFEARTKLYRRTEMSLYLPKELRRRKPLHSSSPPP